MNIDEVMNSAGDAISVTVLLGYFFAGLPAFATILTIIWTALRIYEMCTVQGWLKRRKDNEPSQ